MQIVMYRSFVRGKAHSLGLVGTVRNLKDGSVEIIAQGNKEKLEKFIEHLQSGPLFSRVDNVTVEWRRPSTTFDDFNIIF